MMKKRIIPIAVISTIIFFIIIGYLYLSAMKPIEIAEDTAINIAKKEAQMQTIQKVYTYHGTEAYSVVLGEDQSEQALAVFIPEDVNKPIVIKNQADGTTEQQIIDMVNKEQNPKKIISVTLGMDGNIPIWETVYIDHQNRYVYHYSYFETGTQRKRYIIS